MIDIIKVRSKEAAVAEGGKVLQAIIAGAGAPVLLLSSGGSAAALLDSLESLEGISAFSMLDERYTADPKLSNYLKMYDTIFYERVVENEIPSFSTVPFDGEPLQDSADRTASFLLAWQEENPTGKIVATMGLGRDGHTAGIFPMPEDAYRALFESGKNTVGYLAPQAPDVEARITVTNTFLRVVDAAVMLVTGEEKRPALERVLADGGFLHETPGRIIHEMKRLALVTDVLQL